MRRYLHPVGLSDSPLCRRCEAEEETSAHILCECEALASHRHVYLGSFFLEPEDIKSVSLGAIWNFLKANRALLNRYRAQRACQLRPRYIGTVRSRTQSQINQSINQCTPTSQVLYSQTSFRTLRTSKPPTPPHIPEDLFPLL